MGAVARAPADGYTILFASSSYTVNPSLYPALNSDPAFIRALADIVEDAIR